MKTTLLQQIYWVTECEKQAQNPKMELALHNAVSSLSAMRLISKWLEKDLDAALATVPHLTLSQKLLAKQELMHTFKQRGLI